MFSEENTMLETFEDYENIDRILLSVLTQDAL